MSNIIKNNRMTIIRTYVSYSKGVVSYLANEPGESLFEVIGTVSASNYLGLSGVATSFSGSYLVISGTISASNYLGIPVGTGSNIAEYGATRLIHEPTITAGRAVSSPGQGPQPTSFGTLMTLAFTPDDTTDRAFRIFKIPTSYVSSASFHVHWTKSGDANELNKNVRWRLAYTVFNGSSDIGNGIANIIEFEDTYPDSGTTTRIVHRTSDLTAAGFVAGYYVSIYIEAISPISGTAMSSEPALLSLDLRYRASINSGD